MTPAEKWNLVLSGINILATIGVAIWVAYLKATFKNKGKLYEKNLGTLDELHRKIHDNMIRVIEELKYTHSIPDTLEERIRMNVSRLNIFDRKHIVSKKAGHLLNLWQTQHFAFKRNIINEGQISKDRDTCITLANEIIDETDVIISSVWKDK